MFATPSKIRSIALLVVVAMLPHVAFARDVAIEAYAAREWLRETLACYHITDGVTANELDKLLDLKARITVPELDLKQRLLACVDLYNELGRLMGSPPVSRQAQVIACAGLAMVAQAYATDSDFHVSSTAPTPLGGLGPVVKTGHGPVPMVLVGDYGTAASFYQAFTERNGDRYTMYVVTIPGFGGTPAPPEPANYDPDATPWWDGLVAGVVDLIDTHQLDRPVIVGTQAGAYLATRLAIEHPERIRGAVVLNGLVFMSLRDTRTIELPPTLAQRRQTVARRPDLCGLMFKFLPAAVPSEAAAGRMLDALPAPIQRFVLGVNTRDTATARKQFLDFYAHGDPKAGQYLVELNASDLTEPLGRLKVPLLSIPSVPDDDSPAPDSPSLAQWNEVRLRYPTIPLTVAPMRDVRSYAIVDAPLDVDRAIAAFAAGQPVRIERPHVDGNRPSPRAEVTQYIGSARVAVEYGRPRLNSRAAQQLMTTSAGGVWRTGANEATRISFSSDVTVDGQRLGAGTYGLFTIPGDTEWTVIFNRVADQWGAFSYNPEFDALRIKVASRPAEFQEWLSFTFEPVSPTSARLALAWDRVSVGVTIAVGASTAKSP